MSQFFYIWKSWVHVQMIYLYPRAIFTYQEWWLPIAMFNNQRIPCTFWVGEIPLSRTLGWIMIIIGIVIDSNTFTSTYYIIYTKYVYIYIYIYIYIYNVRVDFLRSSHKIPWNPTKSRPLLNTVGEMLDLHRIFPRQQWPDRAPVLCWACVFAGPRRSSQRDVGIGQKIKTSGTMGSSLFSWYSLYY